MVPPFRQMALQSASLANTSNALLWLFDLGFLLVLLAALLAVVLLRWRGGQAGGYVLLDLAVWTLLCGAAFTLAVFLWPEAGSDSALLGLLFLGLSVLLIAGMLGVAGLVVLTGARWAGVVLWVLLVVVSLVALSTVTALLAVVLSGSGADSSGAGATALRPVSVLVSSGFSLARLGLVAGPLLVVLCLITVARRPALRPGVGGALLIGALGAIPVIATLVLRGASTWNQAPYGVDVVGVSLAVGLVLVLIGRRWHPGSNAAPAGL